MAFCAFIWLSPYLPCFEMPCEQRHPFVCLRASPEGVDNSYIHLFWALLLMAFTACFLSNDSSKYFQPVNHIFLIDGQNINRTEHAVKDDCARCLKPTSLVWLSSILKRDTVNPHSPLLARLHWEQKQQLLSSVGFWQSGPSRWPDRCWQCMFL